MASMAFKASVFIFLLFTSLNSGEADELSLKEASKLPSPHGQVIVERKMGRKMLEVDSFLDYSEPSHNKGHEPRIGNPGGRASMTP